VKAAGGKRLYLRLRAFVITLPVFLAACGSSVTETKKPEAPPEAVTGLHALYQMFAASKAWATDAQVLKLTSIHVTDVPAKPGRAGVWQVTFVSPSLQQARTYTYSVTEESMTLHQGIDSGKAESWSAHGSDHPFLIAAAKFDSDQAYETAFKKAADYSAKNPGMTILYELAQTTSGSNAAWRVIWGESVGSSAFSVLVDATTGAYLETLH
jgi:hypothetical protein